MSQGVQSQSQSRDESEMHRGRRRGRKLRQRQRRDWDWEKPSSRTSWRGVLCLSVCLSAFVVERQFKDFVTPLSICVWFLYKYAQRILIPIHSIHTTYTIPFSDVAAGCRERVRATSYEDIRRKKPVARLVSVLTHFAFFSLPPPSFLWLTCPEGGGGGAGVGKTTHDA